jgi:hypothetical protein
MPEQLYIYRMKRSLPLILFFVLETVTVFAQERNSVDLSIGPALPLGGFANQNGQDPGAGLAQVGGLLDLSYQHRLGKGPFGFSAEARARLNPLNEDANLALAKNMDTGYTYTVAKKSWETGGIFVGAYYRSPLVAKLSMELGVSVGCAEAVLPPIYATAVRNSVMYPGSQDYRTVTSSKVHALAPSALVKAGVRYPLTPHFSLIAYADFCYLKPTFKNVTESVMSTQGLNVPGLYSFANSKGPILAYNYTANITQSMNTLDLAIGLALKL